MSCDKCGAATDGSATCPECGEPLAPVAAMTSAPAAKRPAWLVPVIAAVVLLAIGVGGYFLWSSVWGPTQSGPEGAVTRMMSAFGTYDGEAMLENVTHASLTATDVASFIKQSNDAKTAAGGKPGLKDLKIVETTYNETDKNTAVVKVSAQWLTDQAKGTYTQRTETLTVILQDGKWLVRLFQ
jgi:hypothetical protein